MTNHHIADESYTLDDKSSYRWRVVHTRWYPVSTHTHTVHVYMYIQKRSQELAGETLNRVLYNAFKVLSKTLAGVGWNAPPTAEHPAPWTRRAWRDCWISCAPQAYGTTPLGTSTLCANSSHLLCSFIGLFLGLFWHMQTIIWKIRYGYLSGFAPVVVVRLFLWGLFTFFFFI